MALLRCQNLQDKEQPTNGYKLSGVNEMVLNSILFGHCTLITLAVYLYTDFLRILV